MRQKKKLFIIVCLLFSIFLSLGVFGKDIYHYLLKDQLKQDTQEFDVSENETTIPDGLKDQEQEDISSFESHHDDEGEFLSTPAPSESHNEHSSDSEKEKSEEASDTEIQFPEAP